MDSGRRVLAFPSRIWGACPVGHQLGDEIVIEGIEIRPPGVDSIEFDEAGEALDEAAQLLDDAHSILKLREREVARDRRRFALLAERPEVTLAYVSGRHQALIEEAIATYRLPLPDFVIGDVGTTLYHVGPRHSWVHVETWEEQRAEHTGITDPYLDSLLQVRNAGYLDEYTVRYFGRHDWTVPAEVHVDSFQQWQARHLDDHRPETRIIGSWNYRDE